MSDLAPLVIATLRDKTVTDLMKENDRLQQQLKVYRRIQIVSGGEDNEEEESVVVYSEGQLEEGTFRNAGNLFDVKLKEKKRCPLSELSEVWISVGGYHKNYINPANYDAYLYSRDNEDTDDTKLVALCGSQSWVIFLIHGWPRVHYRTIIQNVEDEDGDMDQDDVMEFILEMLPGIFPNATVQFTEVNLFTRMNKLAIDSLPSGLLSRLREGLDEDREWMDFYGYIVSYYRDIGNTEGASVFGPQSMEIANALVDRFNIHEVNDQTRETINNVIRLHDFSQSVDQTFDELIEELLVIARVGGGGEEDAATNDDDEAMEEGGD